MRQPVRTTLRDDKSVKGMRRAGTVAAAAVAVASLTAGGTSSWASSVRAGGSPAVEKLVPAHYKSAGSITIAVDASYAPNEFFAKNGTITGMDVDLGTALVSTMGLKVRVVNAGFDSILPGLASGKYDLGISSFTDSKARQKIVDFVTYFKAGTSFFEKSHGGPSVTGLNSLCGLRVALEKGTTQADDAQAQSQRCTASGRKAVTVEIFPDQGGANLALMSGRADVAMADSPLADYQVARSHGALKLVGKTYGTAPYGIAMSKQSHLAPAVLAGVRYLMSSGRYLKILKKWGVANGAISNPKINGATG